MPEPSFAQLFDRSRLIRLEQEDVVTQKRTRLEEFAVAAVGFALKHDLAFRRNFLSDFADIKVGVENFEVCIQDRKCADMALKNEVDDTLAIIEFKVPSLLEEHQNPWKPMFWSDSKKVKAGYGCELLKHYPKFSTIVYVVVCKECEKQGDDISVPLPGKTFLVKSRSWKSLLKESKTALEKDLVESLGALGIEELRNDEMKTIKMTTEQLRSFFLGNKALELLEYIAVQKLDIAKSAARNQMIELCTELSNGPLRQLGIQIPESKMGKLSGIPKGFTNAEYGYYSQNNEDFRAEVWFYGNRAGKAELQTLIEKTLKGAARFEEDKDATLRVVCSDKDMRDLEWFSKVLGVK